MIQGRTLIISGQRQRRSITQTSICRLKRLVKKEQHRFDSEKQHVEQETAWLGDI